MKITPREKLEKLERQQSLFTPEARALIRRVYGTLRTDKVAVLTEHFRQAQENHRQASDHSTYLFEHPRRRSDLEKAFELEQEAEEECLDAFEALLTECQRVDAGHQT